MQRNPKGAKSFNKPKHPARIREPFDKTPFKKHSHIVA